MYSHVLGRAYNYGQSLVPGKDSAPNMPQQPLSGGTSFLDQQINTYGMPGDGTAPRRRKPAETPQWQTTQAQAAPAAGGSPFMPNGMPAPQPHQPQPLQQPQPRPAPAQQQAPANYGSVNQEGVYTAGQYAGPQYQAQQMGGFQGPNMGAFNDQQQALLARMLANPGTMNDQRVAQMKGQYTDQAAQMARQQNDQIRGAMAARGRNVNSGQALGQQRQVLSDMNANILNNMRTVDLQAAQQNRQDELAALNAAGQFGQQQFQQALGGYQANLQGMDANRQEQLAGIQSALQNWNVNQDMLGRQSQSQLASKGNQIQEQGNWFNREANQAQAANQTQANWFQREANQAQAANAAAQLANQLAMHRDSFGLQQEQFGWQKSLQQQQMEQEAAARAASAGAARAADDWRQQQWNYQVQQDTQQRADMLAQREWERQMAEDQAAWNYSQPTRQSQQGLWEWLMGGG